MPLDREMETTIVGIGKTDFKNTGVHAVSPGFFCALGIPVRRGRLLDRRDRPGTPHVAVVSEEFVRLYIAGEEPLGKKFALGLGDWSSGDEMAEIVDVVGNVKYGAAENEVTPQVYLSHEQRPRPLHDRGGAYRWRAIAACSRTSTGGRRVGPECSHA